MLDQLEFKKPHKTFVPIRIVPLGSAMTSYTATSSPGGLTGTLAGATAGTITITGLTASTAYTFIVTATYLEGTSTA